MKVDIFSDVQCPWCYIGKRKFEAAAAEFDGTVEIEYHSFELSPDTPVDYDGSTADYLSQRKGMSLSQVEAIQQQITAIAAGVGLPFRLDIARQTNTVKAHELLHYAKSQGRQLDMKERLLKAYFIEGIHVGKLAQLAELATEIGLDGDEVIRVLTENVYLSDVKADVALAQQYGIQAVPFFVVAGRYGISGAQDPATFVGALRQAAAS